MVTVTSSVANPLTTSSKVNVTVNGSLFATWPGTPVISTVGSVVSRTAVSLTSLAGPVLPALSVAASAATFTVRSPLFPVAVNVPVYTLPF